MRARLVRVVILTAAVGASVLPFATSAAAPSGRSLYDALEAGGLNILPVWKGSPGRTWTDARYAGIRAKGFGVVRFMLHWVDFEPSPGQWDQTSVSTLDTAVRRARNAGLHVVLVPIADYGSGGMRYYPAWATSPGGDSVAVVNRSAAGYLRMLAQRYGSDPAVVGFEPVSEPHRWPIDQNAVLGMYNRAFAEIRPYAPDKLLIAEPSFGDSDMTGANGSLITDKRNVVFSLHYYYLGNAGTGYASNRTVACPCGYQGDAAYDRANWSNLEAHLQITLDWLWWQDIPLWIGEYGDTLGNTGHDRYLRDLTGRFRKFEGDGVPMPNGLPSILGHTFWEFYERSGKMSATVAADPSAWQPFADSLTSSPSPSPSPTPTPTPAPTPTPTPSAGAWQHIVWIVLENKRYDQIVGNGNAPYLNSLAGRYGLATNLFAEAHPSLPNYVALTSGSTQGITDDSDPNAHRLAVPSIFSQLGPDGWRALQESMPSPCASSNSGLYAVRHNPAAYYVPIANGCLLRDVPLGDSPDISARLTFITPNLCHDMHSSPCAATSASEVAAGDAWLAQFLPSVLATPEYRSGSTVIFITWDEDDYSSDQRVPTFVISPSTPAGSRNPTRLTHYSMLRYAEETLGLPLLGEAASAPRMNGSLGL